MSVHHAGGEDLPPQVHARKATWFELFFDLVFVVAVAQLSGRYAHHFDLAGAAGSALLLMAMWWCWLGHTFHATRFDQQRPDQRWLGLAQIGAVCVIAYGVSDAFGERAAGFALGLAAFKALLVLAYQAERRWRGAHGLIAAYSGLYGLQALLWAVSAGLPPTPRLVLWGLALALDLASPWWVARYTAAVPPHPEHLPERFGLFTIILLGEGVASVVHALDHGPVLHGTAVVAALLGAALAFLTWLGYFEVTRAHDERVVHGTAGGRQLRLWAYGHVPIYLGVFSLAAGTVAMAGDDAWGAPQWALYGGGVALIALGLALLRRAR
ncbi:low temperature requirement protein A [Ideonella sp. 4Y11]|uniref:Low temperature requirement protein A n=1 Tax=Ideonella aquatica TaxID=2824119 RepID=A0A940YF73_9BURK|nr:low temperature requirement protein A [Ideonella aquatica]MBQ0958194.1 low temperature requirement protein A [Ideonella aquatica]